GRWEVLRSYRAPDRLLNHLRSAQRILRSAKFHPNGVGARFCVSHRPIEAILARRKAARDDRHIGTGVCGGVNFVDHLVLRNHSRLCVVRSAVEGHAVVECCCADSSFFCFFRKPVNIQRAGTEVVHIRSTGNTDIRGDHTVPVDNLRHCDDRLIGQTKESQIHRTASEKYGLESIHFNETTRRNIVSRRARKRLGSHQHFPKPRTHSSCCRASGLWSGGTHSCQSGCHESTELDKLASAGFFRHGCSCFVFRI